MFEEKKHFFQRFLRQKFFFGVFLLLVLGGSFAYTAFSLYEMGEKKYQEIFVSEENFAEKTAFDKKTEEKISQHQEILPIKIVDEQSAVISAVEKASPAVVSIVATAEIPVFEQYYADPFFFDLPEEFAPFFEMQRPQKMQNGTEKKRIGAGTGFLVSSDGYIVTNKHVVSEEEAEYTVYLNDEKHKGEKVIAKVLARDPSNDLAILKIEKTDLPFLEFGSSDDVKVGQTAITIGYALGEFENTVSKGVISGLSRSIVAGGFGVRSEKLKNLVQIDAAINPGNSGGPMLDLEARVIGVNVAMANAENIGFAILGNEAKRVFEEVKNTGKIAPKEMAFVGIRYVPITVSLQKANNLPVDYGIIVLRGKNPEDLAVIPASPADKAGILENDIILEIDGKKLTLENSFADSVSEKKPGEMISLKILSKGQEKDLKIELGKL